MAKRRQIPVEKVLDDEPEMVPIPMDDETTKVPSLLGVKTAPVADPTPVEDLPNRIQFRVWEKITPTKEDQVAGFRSYAKRKGLGPLTPTEWQSEFQKFMQRPVR